jgi:uncharacterized membrane protein
MTKRVTATFPCSVCGKVKPRAQLVPAETVREAISALILKDHPDWPQEGFVCREDLNRYRADYIEDIVEAEKGEVTSLEGEVVESLKEHEILAKNVDAEFERDLTVGERWSDRIAGFGGSWRFILLFGAVLVVWMAVNSIALLAKPFDPYPFILLNLVLSCLAAVQAPIIMMSQNRQEDRDRLRSQHDYQVNLKAELEIRHLHEKIDHLLSRQWERLAEIQKVQVEFMKELVEIREKRKGG